MFFLKELTHTVTLAPQYFTQGLHDLIRYALYRQLEGACSGKHGYIVAIIGLDSVSPGTVLDSSGGLLTATQNTPVPLIGMMGSASFEVKFKAILYKPFKGEVVDLLVRTVNKMGFFGEAGAGVQVFVSAHLIPSRFVFDGREMPAMFVSHRHNRPTSSSVYNRRHDEDDNGHEDDKEANEEDEKPTNSFEMDDEQPEIIAPGSKVRARIVGTRVDATEIFAIGTIKEEHLGLIHDDI